jgi:dihydroxyacetone kinase-like protein
MDQRVAGSSLQGALESLVAHEDEFRALDAAAGDGDLGITVRATSAAALEWLGAQPGAIPARAVLSGLAEVCATTNPSTFASLVSRGLAAAAKALDGRDEASLDTVIAALDAGIAMVAKRGGASRGEKTFLDALIPALESMQDAGSLGEAIPAMRLAAIRGTEERTGDLGQHGRAAWVGERARGIPDAGSVVVIRFLEALEGPGVVAWQAGLPEGATE